MNEDPNIEYKQSWRDEYLKWICGFANAVGGKIYIRLMFWNEGRLPDDFTMEINEMK